MWFALHPGIQQRIRVQDRMFVSTQARQTVRHIALGFFFLLASGNALANTEYFILDYTGPTWPKYPTGAAACTAYKNWIQTSQDTVNPGGTTIVKNWPDENVPP